MSKLQLLWRTANSFNFIDPVDGMASRSVIIPGIEQNIYDPNELEELILWQADEAAKEIRAKREDVRKPMTKDFGNALFEVKASNAERAERLHGKWWKGTQ